MPHDPLPLLVDLGQRNLALALAREVFAGRHAEDPREPGRDPGNEDRKSVVGRAADGTDDGQRAHEAVLGPKNRFANVAEQTGSAAFSFEPDADLRVARELSGCVDRGCRWELTRRVDHGCVTEAS